MTFASAGITSPLIGLFLEELGASYSQISFVMGTFVFIVLVGNFFWGRLSDYMRRRKPLLLLGPIGASITFFLLSQATSVPMAWAIRMGEALALSAYASVSLAIVGDILDTSGTTTGPDVKPGWGRSIGLYRGIGSLAFALGATLGGRLADIYTLRSAFLVCSTLYVLAGLSATLLDDSFARDAKESSTGPGRPAIRLPQFNWRSLPWPFLAGVLLWSSAHSASASMWPNYLSSHGYTKTAIGTLWGVAAMVEMPAMFFAGLASDVLGRPLVLLAGGLGISLVNIGYALLVTSLPALIALQFVRGFGFGSYTTSAMTFTAETGDRYQRGGNSGLFFSTASCGQLIGTLGSGVVADTFGFAALYFTCSAFAISAALCFWLLYTAQALPHTQTVPESLE